MYLIAYILQAYKNDTMERGIFSHTQSRTIQDLNIELKYIPSGKY